MKIPSLDINMHGPNCHKMSCNKIEILGAPRSTTTTTTTTTNETVSIGSGATFLYNSDRKWILTTDQNQTLTLTSVGTTSNLRTPTPTCIPEKGSSIQLQLQYARSPSSLAEKYSCVLTTNIDNQKTIWKCQNQNTKFSFTGGAIKSD